MTILKKHTGPFQRFDWLNFDSLPDSKGFKFELYPPERLKFEGYISLSFNLFGHLLDETIVSPFKPGGKWGDFCLETWDFENDNFDYSIEGKSPQTSRYLSLLQSSNIEPGYAGFCKCEDWKPFLEIVLDCVVHHQAPYSLLFFVPEPEILFYFHHTTSFGIYYRKLGKAILEIIEKAKLCGMIGDHTNDDRIVELI